LDGGSLRRQRREVAVDSALGDLQFDRQRGRRDRMTPAAERLQERQQADGTTQERVSSMAWRATVCSDLVRAETQVIWSFSRLPEKGCFCEDFRKIEIKVVKIRNL
jgi:hypothetical protein